MSLDSQIPCGVDSSDGTLSKSVRDVLAEKHPPGRVAAADTLLESGCADPPCYDPILFEQLTGDLIKWAALRLEWMPMLGADYVLLLVLLQWLCVILWLL